MPTKALPAVSKRYLSKYTCSKVSRFAEIVACLAIKQPRLSVAFNVTAYSAFSNAEHCIHLKHECHVLIISTQFAEGCYYTGLFVVVVNLSFL